MKDRSSLINQSIKQRVRASVRVWHANVFLPKDVHAVWLGGEVVRWMVGEELRTADRYLYNFLMHDTHPLSLCTSLHN